MSLLEQITGDVLRRLSGADSTAARTSATPSAPLGLGKGASFDAATVDLSVGLSAVSSAFSNSFSRLNLAVSGLQSSANILDRLLSATDELIRLAERAGAIDATDAERERLNSSFQRKVLEFRDILNETDDSGFDFRDKSDLIGLLTESGIDPSAASRLMEYFSRLAPDDNELGYSRINDEDVVYTGLTVRNWGDGTFQAAQTFAIGVESYQATTGDLNSDGFVDIAATAATDGQVSVLFGNGDGTFLESVGLTTAGFPVGLSIADLDEDGKNDIVAAAAVGEINVFYGNGDGTFEAAVTYSGFSVAVFPKAIDVDGDEHLDLVFGENATGFMDVMLGNGDRTFDAAVQYDTAVGALGSAIADVDGDSNLDIIVAANDADEINILYGVGDGTFEPAVTLTSGDAPSGIDVGDIDEDGYTDIIVTNADSPSVGIFYGQGSRTFDPMVSNDYGANPFDIHLTDIDGDEHLDLVGSIAGDGKIFVLLGNGDQTFDASRTFTAIAASFGALADVNGDSALDMVSPDLTNGFVSVLLANTQIVGTISSAVARGGSGSDPLSQSLRTQGDALVAANTLKKLRQDIEQDISNLNGVLGELRGATQFVVSGSRAVADLNAQLIGISDAATLADLLGQRIRALSGDPQVAAHSDLDRKLADELLAD